jgi:hypothetical protein
MLVVRQCSKSASALGTTPDGSYSVAAPGEDDNNNDDYGNDDDDND